MKRQILKIDELLDVLNDELSRFDTCVECRFKSIIPSGDLDETGCNWSHANLNCRGYPATVCEPAAARVMAEAKRRYNVW